MRDWLREYVGAVVVMAIGVLLLVLFALSLRAENAANARYHDAKCAGLYSLARTNADSLAIARDGCAAYLGRKDGTE